MLLAVPECAMWGITSVLATPHSQLHPEIGHSQEHGIPSTAGRVTSYWGSWGRSVGSSPQGGEVRGGKCGAGEEVGCLRGKMHPCWMRSRKTGWNGRRGREKTLSSDKFRYRPSPKDFGELIGKWLCFSASCQSVSRAEVIIDTVDTLWL